MIEFKPGSYGYIAQRNLRDALSNMETSPALCAELSQQAVEKLLKQYMQEVLHCRDIGILHTHSIRRLLASAKIEGLTPYAAQLIALTEVYYNTRYPGEEYYEVNASEAEKLYLAAAAACTVISLEIEKHRM